MLKGQLFATVESRTCAEFGSATSPSGMSLASFLPPGTLGGIRWQRQIGAPSGLVPEAGTSVLDSSRLQTSLQKNFLLDKGNC